MWLDLQITPLDKKNQLLGWLITFIDISARKKAENSLQKSEKDYRDLVDNALVGIYKADRNGKLSLQMIQLLIFLDTIQLKILKG